MIKCGSDLYARFQSLVENDSDIRMMSIVKIWKTGRKLIKTVSACGGASSDFSNSHYKLQIQENDRKTFSTIQTD